MENKEVKLNAAQRLILLEEDQKTNKETMEAIKSQLMVLAEEIDTINNNMYELSSKFNSLLVKVQAIAELGDKNKPINNKNIHDVVAEVEAQKLEQQTENLKEQKVLLPTESAIEERSFVVGRLLDSEGNVISPRVQFALTTIDESARANFLGKNKGDLVKLEEAGNSIEITEFYKIAELENKDFESPEVTPQDLK
jgi:hypothetical protein